MGKFLIAWLCLPFLAISSYALTISDDFNRNNLGDTGWKSYIEQSGGSVSISNNELVISNGTDEGIGDSFAYLDLGQNLTNATVQGVLNYDLGGRTSNAFYLGLNAHESDIRNGEGANYRTTGKGYGVIADFFISDWIILDQTATDSRDASQNLVDGPLSFSVNTDVNFELTYNSDNSLEARFWNVGTSRPDDPNIQYVPGTQPVATGTNLFFGVTDEGTLRVDDLAVTDGEGGITNNVAVPEPLNISLLAMACGAFLLWFRR